MNRFALVFSVVAAVAASAQPVISSGGVLNAASYAPDIAQGSMFVVFGGGLGPQQIQYASSLPIPNTLAGTSVFISAGGQTLSAPVVYTSAGQLAAILPSNAPIGSATLTVSAGGQASAPATINVVRSSFGVFTNNGRGTGSAVAQNFVSQSDQPRNGLTDSARPGQVVILWGTGLGPISGSDAALPTPGDLDTALEILVGGQPARILYKGRSGCCAAIDQIVIEVPQNVSGCYVPISVRTGGVAAPQVTTFSVAPSGLLCTEPGLLTSADLDKARAQGNLKLGSLLLVSYSFGGLTSVDYGLISFSRARYEALAETTQRFAAAAPGSCEAWGYDGQNVTQIGAGGTIGADFFNDYLFWSGDQPLDAGARLTLGNNGRNVTFDRLIPGYYSNVLIDTQSGQFGSYLRPGTYSVDNGSGGADIPAFRTNIEVPTAPQFTLGSTDRVSRSNGMTVRWTGGSPDQRILISGSSWSQNWTVGGVFTCVQRGASGSFTVPASILSVLPASGAFETGQGGGVLYVYSFSPFQRSNVPGLDAFYAATLNLDYRLVKFE